MKICGYFYMKKVCFYKEKKFQIYIYLKSIYFFIINLTSCKSLDFLVIWNSLGSFGLSPVCLK